MRQKKPAGASTRYDYSSAYWEKNKKQRSLAFRKWQTRNRERRNAYMRAYRAATPENAEKRSQLNKAWREANAEHIRRSKRDYAIKNRERIRKYMRRYTQRRYPMMRNRILEQTKIYAKLHPEVRRRCALNYKRRHPNRYAAQNRVSHVRRAARMRGADVSDRNVGPLIKSWRLKRSFICAYCRKRFTIKWMHVDHIIPIAKGGKHTVSNLCRSCPPCNIRKRDKILTN